jgi:hypothetical protein
MTSPPRQANIFTASTHRKSKSWMHIKAIPISTIGSTTKTTSKFNFDFVSSPINDERHFTFDSQTRSGFKDRESLHLRLKNAIVAQS